MNKQTKQKTPKLPDRKTVLDLIPIRDYKNGVFLLSDGSLLNLLWIQGRSYLNANEEETAMHIQQVSLFFREYSDDLKFVSMNFPTNTTKQQNYIRKQKEKNLSQHYQAFLSIELEKLKWLGQNHHDIEHFIFLYAKDANDYEKKESLILQKSNFLFKHMPYKKKIQVLQKLCNLHLDVDVTI